MPQDKHTGAEADQFGRENGAKLIKLLGAKRVKPGSNECVLGDKRVSIHSARKNTDSVGVTKRCLEQIHAVLGAFEQEDGSFVVIELPADEFAKHAIPTRSVSAAGKVVLVKRSVFENSGKRVRVVLPDELKN